MKSIKLVYMLSLLFSMTGLNCFGSVLSERMKAVRDQDNNKRASKFGVLNYHQLYPYPREQLAAGTKVKIVRGLDVHPIKNFKVLCSLEDLYNKLKFDELKADINMIHIRAFELLRKRSKKFHYTMLALQMVPFEKIEKTVEYDVEKAEKQLSYYCKEAVNYFRQQFKLDGLLYKDFASNIYVLEGMDYLFHASALEKVIGAPQVPGASIAAAR